jgi:hypothetical protein
LCGYIDDPWRRIYDEWRAIAFPWSYIVDLGGYIDDLWRYIDDPWPAIAHYWFCIVDLRGCIDDLCRGIVDLGRSTVDSCRGSMALNNEPSTWTASCNRPGLQSVADGNLGQAECIDLLPAET